MCVDKILVRFPIYLKLNGGRECLATRTFPGCCLWGLNQVAVFFVSQGAKDSISNLIGQCKCVHIPAYPASFFEARWDWYILYCIIMYRNIQVYSCRFMVFY